MKKLFIRLFALIAVSSIFLLVGSSYKEKADINKEEAAVKAAIQESSDAYHARDFNRMSAIWVHNESIVRMNAGPGGSNYNQGWKGRETFYKKLFKDYPELTGNREVNSNYNIKVYSQSA